ncbi:MAG: putative lipid II flippase FtsW [Treponema sp.]|jgi:cell division protein FtsW|nr:putative lipid II flippase FtsW [Treponema sp.]
MYQFEAERSPRFAGGSYLLVACILLLAGIGLVTLYSSSYALASRLYRDGGLYFISRQLKAGALGIVLFFLASRVNLDVLRKLIKPLVIFTVIFCILTFIPGIGDTRNGASRWIKLPVLGVTFQPSELVKLILPLYLAHIFDKKQERLDEFSTGVLPPVLVTALFFIIIYLQNNFSTAVFIAVNALFIFFLAGVRLRYFFSAIIMLLPLSGLLILTKEHRLRRLISYIKPEWEPQGAGYQVGSSVRTIISGGFLGKGLGQGTRKVASIPEVHSDFIFTSFAEETGFLGVILIFALFGGFAFFSYRGAMRSASQYRRLLACGLVTMILSQAMLNIAVVSGSLPATGLPLPFFSAGGSSLACTLLMTGLIVNICRSGDYQFQDIPYLEAGGGLHVR